MFFTQFYDQLRQDNDDDDNILSQFFFYSFGLAILFMDLYQDLFGCVLGEILLINRELIGKIIFVQHPFLSDRKGSHDPESISPRIANPKFAYE